MFKKIAISIIILIIYSTIPVVALQQDLQQQVDQYYNNTKRLMDLNMDKVHLENNIEDLNGSLVKSEESKKNIDNNIELFKSEINTLEITIQKNEIERHEIERNIQLIKALNTKESIFLLGTSIGLIAGIWIVSLVLFLVWRR